MESQAFSSLVQDKSFWLVVATIVSTLALKLFGLNLSIEQMATIAVTVSAFVVSSKSKQAKIISVEIAAAGAAATPPPPVSAASAAAAINAALGVK